MIGLRKRWENWVKNLKILDNSQINDFFSKHFSKQTYWYNTISYRTVEPKLINFKNSEENLPESIKFVLNKRNQFFKIILYIILLIIIYTISVFRGHTIPFQFIKYAIIILFGMTVSVLYSTKDNTSSIELTNIYLKYNFEILKWIDIKAIRIVTTEYRLKLLSNTYHYKKELYIFLNNGRVLIRDIVDIPINKKVSFENEDSVLGHYISNYSKAFTS